MSQLNRFLVATDWLEHFSKLHSEGFGKANI